MVPIWLSTNFLLIAIILWNPVSTRVSPLGTGPSGQRTYQRQGVDYTMHPSPVNWLQASKTCQDNKSDLLCFSTQSELISILEDSLKLWKGTEIWISKRDCDEFANQRCASLSVKDFSKNGGLGQWDFSFNCSIILPFVCKTRKEVSIVDPLPDLQEPSDTSVVCQGIQRRDISWPTSVGGTIVRIECPFGQIGYAFWNCSKETRDWFPENPNLSDCKSVEMAQVFQQMPKIDLVQTTKDLHATIQSLKYGGDITVAVDIMDKVDDVYRSQAPAMTPAQKQSVLEESSRDIINTCNKLVDTKDAWQDIPKAIRTETASKFLSAVDETGVLLVSNSPTHDKIIQTDNVVLHVVKPQGPDFQQTINFPTDTSWQKKAARISLPVPVASKGDNDSGVIFAWYSDLRSVLPSEQVSPADSNINRGLNSAVVSAKVTGKGSDVKREILIVMEHLEEGGENPQCVYWDTNVLKWSTQSCSVKEFNATHTTCVCDHLTNFAILMDLRCSTCDLPSAHKIGLGIVTMTGCFVSLFCLSICIVIFTWFRTLWSIQNTIHRNLCISLWLAQALLLAGIDRTEYKMACSIIAGFLHYFFLAAFFWMFLEAFHILLLVIHVFTPKKLRVFQYYLVGYGGPAIIVGITAAMRHQDYGTSFYCWLSTENGTIWSFIGPVAAIVLFNAVALVKALWATFRITRSKDKTKVEGLRMWLRGAAVLLPLLGITWSVGFLYLHTGSIYLAYVFAILNSLQGFAIFVFHVLLNKKVKNVINRSLERSSLSRSGTNRHTKSSSFQGMKFSKNKKGKSTSSESASTPEVDSVPALPSSDVPTTQDSKALSDDELTDDDFIIQEPLMPERLNPRPEFLPIIADAIPEEHEESNFQIEIQPEAEPVKIKLETDIT